jgi:hypothetical protein
MRIDFGMRIEDCGLGASRIQSAFNPHSTNQSTIHNVPINPHSAIRNASINPHSAILNPQ